MAAVSLGLSAADGLAITGGSGFFCALTGAGLLTVGRLAGSASGADLLATDFGT